MLNGTLSIPDMIRAAPGFSFFPDFSILFYASFVSDAAILANTMSYPSFP